VTDAVMAASEFIAGIGRATECTCDNEHRPAPLRFVWHHILPEVCGGHTIRSNLVSVCDNCHYGIHALMYDLKINGVFSAYARFGATRRAYFAREGYVAAIAAGTVARIPSTGGVG
jgi:hypothetical protein